MMSMNNMNPSNALAAGHGQAHRGATYRSKILTLCILLVLGLGLVRLKTYPKTIDLHGTAFNSMAWHVRIADAPFHLSEMVLQQGLEQVLAEVDQSLSSWRADSEVAKFNRLPPNTSFQITPLFYHALQQAKRVSRATQGAYDVTISPLIDAWGFGPQGRPLRRPNALQLAQLKQRTGWQSIQLAKTEQGQYVVLKTKDVHINMSSLGEGSGVDAMRIWLERQGIQNYMVSVAGTLIAKGHNQQHAWQIAIEKPDGSNTIQTVLALSDVVVSTSGAYRNYYEENGTRYSHTIDPATAKPISHHTASITLIHPLANEEYAATYVDAMTTGFNVFGADKGIEFANRQPYPLAVYYIEKINHQFLEKSSQAFQKYALASEV